MSATLDNKENLDADNYFLLAARTLLSGGFAH